MVKTKVIPERGLIPKTAKLSLEDVLGVVYISFIYSHAM